MAYVSKDLKSKIVANVKKVLPKGWKATFAVRHHSTIVMTVRSAPIDLKNDFDCSDSYYGINPYHFEKHVKNKSLIKPLQNIIDALNTDNYDNSDIMTDYFDVGHYIDLRFGEYDKPFVSTKEKTEEKPTTKQSEELTTFYRAYKDWLNNGAPEDKPFTRKTGLCWNLSTNFLGGNSVDDYDQLLEEMQLQFTTAGLNAMSPFNNIKDHLRYSIESKRETMHLNTKRVEWVNDHC